MSKLTIDDLNFCECELPGETEVKGGLRYSATYSTSFDSAHSSGYTAYYYFNNGSYSYVLAGEVSGAVAGAVSGAIAVGGITYTYANAVAGST